MLSQAMDVFQVAKRQHKENVKAQHVVAKGIDGKKTFFRASEMGMDERKIIYGFFAHQLPKIERGAKNLRQLENGDFVHDRYQTAWEDMGVLISMEKRLSSKTDDYLGGKDENGNPNFPWEWAGHYDGELDMNLLRAHALGKVTVESVHNEDTGLYEIQIDLDEAFAQEIGIFNAAGEVSEEYEANRPRMVADIKTMNPWGFKRIKNEHDVSQIVGYLDQISFYMYMLNTPYGSIYIESKDNNDVVEVQILWKDFYEGVELDWDTNLHGEQTSAQVRMKIDMGRFFGDDTREGVVPRITRLHGLVEELRKADADGDLETVARLVPNRCDGVTKPEGFPCSWGHKAGDVQYCEFYDHCWNGHHQGRLVRPAPKVEACPEEAVWSFTDTDDAGVDHEIRIDSRKVPKGVDQEGFLQLVDIGALDYTKFLVDAASEGFALPASIQEEVSMVEAEKTALNSMKGMFNESGELNIGAPTPPTEAEEFQNDAGSRAIICTNCHKESIFNRLGKGNKHTCMHCKHVNQVIKL